jgi:cobalamin biosynthesis Mg chelatase CobN
MASAAIRILFFVSLVFGGLSGNAAAGIQLDPADTLNSTVSTVTTQTGDITDAIGNVDDATDDLTQAVDDTTDAATGSVNDATGSVSSGSATTESVTESVTNVLSGSTSSGADSTSSSGSNTSGSSGGSGETTSTSSRQSASASNRGSPRTRFDRLPARYETLLERIESGFRVQASIAQLRALLANASPELRATILRLIRAEIRRLEKGGLTPKERAAVRRLTPLLKAFQASRPPDRISLRDGTASLPAASSYGRAQVAGAITGPPLSSERAGSGEDEAERGSGAPSGPLFPLPSPPGPAYWLLVLLAAIAGALWLGARAPRHVLPTGVRGIVEIRGAEISALAATIGLIAVVGAALLIQALFL